MFVYSITLTAFLAGAVLRISS